ncbi:hypothetical protein [Alteribacillus sp. YIM 98480]|uniref:hypothetical protein n=1 Tax=Alteribacillus sp. YIM 98480 TaxID=2606599 RepID=UPI00131D8B05|nr:hypothetical protein [Alteribacillus sp. YIM 98480]
MGSKFERRRKEQENYKKAQEMFEKYKKTLEKEKELSPPKPAEKIDLTENSFISKCLNTIKTIRRYKHNSKTTNELIDRRLKLINSTQSYENPESIVTLDLSDVLIPKKVLMLIGEVYNHSETSKQTKDLVRFELNKLLGSEYDIKGFLDDPMF